MKRAMVLILAYLASGGDVFADDSSERESLYQRAVDLLGHGFEMEVLRREERDVECVERMRQYLEEWETLDDDAGKLGNEEIILKGAIADLRTCLICRPRALSACEVVKEDLELYRNQRGF